MLSVCCLSRHCCCLLVFLQQLPRIVAAACSSEVSRRDVALCDAVLPCVVQERYAEVRVLFALLAVVAICHGHRCLFLFPLLRDQSQHWQCVHLEHL